MAITFPRNDIMENGGFVQQGFRLDSRAEYSRLPNGRTIVKHYGSGLWKANWSTKSKQHNDAIDFEAMIHSLNFTQKFFAYDLRRPYPLAYPTGSFSDSGKIASINANNKALALKALPANFQITRGDYFSFPYTSNGETVYALHQVMETVQASGLGNTTQFEVMPFIRSGAAVDIAVTFKKPSALFMIDPDSWEPQTDDSYHSSAAFSAFQWV